MQQRKNSYHVGSRAQAVELGYDLCISACAPRDTPCQKRDVVNVIKLVNTRCTDRRILIHSDNTIRHMFVRELSIFHSTTDYHDNDNSNCCGEHDYYSKYDSRTSPGMCLPAIERC
ncbi:hypothetical protein Y032_0377g271 [Ancylostoma ceylanicum]|uniref:Uncharacterized protein n=1 Tax=Ancylostoma ceylanicum TaxID=53326 RepID=A0A016RTG3_9BILA|nr:hypothetical protein Y032_0377g271 [Ancylostoma ceylanicum]